MTKKEMFNEILTNYALTDELRAFVEHEIELLSRKRAGGEKKPTAKQVANNAVKEQILSEMEDGKLYTVSDMIRELPSCIGMSNQRASALVKQMVDSNVVEKVTEKRKSYFRRIGE